MREAGERLGWQKVKRGKRGDERGGEEKQEMKREVDKLQER